MNVLINYERSGIVRRAFREKGHNAYSCDLEPADDGEKEFHIVDDALSVIDRDGWDLMIAHPPCTYLSVSGLHWNKRGRMVNGRPRADLTDEALLVVQRLLDSGISKIALENPIGCISTRIRKPSQVIQPWQFGEDASKATCLWLKNLSPLKHTTVIRRPRWIKCPCCDDYWCQIHQLHVYDCECVPVDDLAAAGVDPFDFYYSKYYANQTPSGQNKLGPSPTRAAERAKTYPGIALAMAEQWGNSL